MSMAISKGIMKCVSTDTIRTIMRLCNENKSLSALHRSSFEGHGSDAVADWHASATVLSKGIDAVIDDAIYRRSSLVIEGVHLIPGTEILAKWSRAGGVGAGIVLHISDPQLHMKLLRARGEKSGKGSDRYLKGFDRIRTIQEELKRLGSVHGW